MPIVYSYIVKERLYIIASKQANGLTLGHWSICIRPTVCVQLHGVHFFAKFDIPSSEKVHTKGSRILWIRVERGKIWTGYDDYHFLGRQLAQYCTPVGTRVVSGCKPTPSAHSQCASHTNKLAVRPSSVIRFAVVSESPYTSSCEVTTQAAGRAGSGGHRHRALLRSRRTASKMRVRFRLDDQLNSICARRATTPVE